MVDVNNLSDVLTMSNMTRWLRTTLKKQKIQTYEIAMMKTPQRGEGYLGDVTLVEILGVTVTGNRVLFNFAIKNNKRSKKLRDVIPLRLLNINELRLYGVQRNFVRFQRKKKIVDIFDNMALHYDGFSRSNEEVLVLQDLKAEGYCTHDKKLPMTYDEIIHVVDMYAKFHAISFALRSLKKQHFQELVASLTHVLKFAVMSQVLNEDEFFDDLRKLALEKNEPVLAQKLGLLSHLVDYIDTNDPFMAIVHGDCNPSNYLFKYDDEEKDKVQHVCMVDFQFCRLGPPVYDLSNFLFSCMPEDDLEYFHDLLRYYYDSFSHHLIEYKCNPKVLYPFEQFKNQWRNYGKLGLRMMISESKVFLAEDDEIVDLEEIVEKNIQHKYSPELVQRCSQKIFPMLQLAIDEKII